MGMGYSKLSLCLFLQNNLSTSSGVAGAALGPCVYLGGTIHLALLRTCAACFGAFQTRKWILVELLKISGGSLLLCRFFYTAQI